MGHLEKKEHRIGSVPPGSRACQTEPIFGTRQGRDALATGTPYGCTGGFQTRPYEQDLLCETKPISGPGAVRVRIEGRMPAMTNMSGRAKQSQFGVPGSPVKQSQFLRRVVVQNKANLGGTGGRSRRGAKNPVGQAPPYHRRVKQSQCAWGGSTPSPLWEKGYAYPVDAAKQSQWRQAGPFVVCPQGHQRKRPAASLRAGLRCKTKPICGGGPGDGGMGIASGAGAW